MCKGLWAFLELHSYAGGRDMHVDVRGHRLASREWPARVLWASNGGLVFTELTLWLEADHLLSVHWPRDSSLFDLNSPLPGQHASLPIFIASCGLN